MQRQTFAQTGESLGESGIMANHRLEAGAETVHWGYFDAALKPLLTIDSGDTITISTVSGTPARCRSRAPA